MKKINVLTLYGNANFGNKMQNYAIFSIIRKFGYSPVNLVDYKENIYNSFKKFIKSILLNFNFFKINHLYEARELKFKHFDRKYLPKRVFNQKNLNDSIMNFVGSDQVWNYSFDVNLEFFFLKNSKYEKNAAIAASFGVACIPDNLKYKYIDGLNNFKFLSVREESGKKIVEDLTKRDDVSLILDPTMLIEIEEWDKIICMPRNFPTLKYIYLYFLGDSSTEVLNEIKTLAMKNDLIIINALDQNDKYYINGPAEILYLLKNASIIFTDSFHATVFSILYNKPFMVFDRNDNHLSMKSRIDTLLNTFKLSSHKYISHIPNNIMSMVDYLECNKILLEQRKKSMDFIKSIFSYIDGNGKNEK